MILEDGVIFNCFLTSVQGASEFLDVLLYLPINKVLFQPCHYSSLSLPDSPSHKRLVLL